jgi:aminoglycoside phosphotransferase (APT) family kinase protein
MDEWSLRHLDLLTTWDARAAASCVGSSLVHGDIRADNLLIASDGEPVVVDWPHASIGAPWVDVALFAVATSMQGGPPPEVTLARAPGVAAVEPDLVTAFVVGLAGFFTNAALYPPPPGLPTLRRFQAAQGEVARRWAARRLGLDPPP